MNRWKTDLVVYGDGSMALGATTTLVHVIDRYFFFEATFAAIFADIRCCSCWCSSCRFGIYGIFLFITSAALVLASTRDSVSFLADFLREQTHLHLVVKSWRIIDRYIMLDIILSKLWTAGTLSRSSWSMTMRPPLTIAWWDQLTEP